MDTSPGQLNFGDLIQQAEADNRRRRFERATAGLPGEMEAAIRYHRQQIKAHHAAVQELDLATAEKIAAAAHMLAVKVNHGDKGILASDGAPGYVLSRRCAAAAGKAPLFGQAGQFRIEVAGVAILVAMDGMFGFGGPLPGFSANAIEFDRKFISPTGFRSFLGCHVDLPRGSTTAEFACLAIAYHIDKDMKGKLVTIEQHYRKPRKPPGKYE